MTTPRITDSDLEPVDAGPEPFVVDIESATMSNSNYRTALWTGAHLQMTVMNIPPGGDIGLEVHPDRDQFLRVEGGEGLVRMGPAEDELPFDHLVYDGWAILVPAGTWHNVANVGEQDLRLYALYAPPEHAHGTIHINRAEADAAHH